VSNSLRLPERTSAPVDVPPPQWDFPDPTKKTKRNGLLATGADLDPSTLVYAYQNGIFPWPHDEAPLPWFSPNPRGVLPLDHFKKSKSLRQTMQRCGWTATVDNDFAGVIANCSTRNNGEGTWISDDMRAAYTKLHELGWAHSVEIWNGETLVGGCYGILLGGVFTGESMFHRATNASKIALFELCARMHEAGGSLIDVQMVTDHLATLGAIAIHRNLFLELLSELRNDEIRLLCERLPVSRLADLVIVVES
jgi:leucyl/phenylalanyl-tRNA---protein transferase